MSKVRVVWSGTATAVTSIAHGGETLGTVTYLRREKFFQPDGTIVDVPVISGNAVRGMLRDVAADLWWTDAGEPPLTAGVFHTLWSGGTLTKTSGTPLTGERLVQVKNVCPVVSVFGAAGGGRIIGGILQVGKLIPVCAETVHLLPYSTPADTLPSMWDITQIEYESRFPNTPTTVPLNDKTGEGDEVLTQMRYGFETFLPGTRFYSEFTLTWPNPVEIEFFTDVLAAYRRHATVGGNTRSGHGRLAFQLDGPAASFGTWKRNGTPLTQDELELLALLN